ncbi:MAG: prepilin-type N-terminal cleavage/methylation domain-containing protein [Patescibacteria group bacterium]
MIKKILTNKKGVTLIELLVAVTLFAIIILSATQIFNMVVEGQRSAIASQNIQESMRFAFEMMSKEIRMAQKDGVGVYDTCPLVGENKIYDSNVPNTELYFKNYHDECVIYYVDAGYLMIQRNGEIAATTPGAIRISNLKFYIVDNIGNEQSQVTIKMDIEATGKELHKQTMKMQTTVSSRYYE